MSKQHKPPKYQVPRNDKGGIAISENELAAAFQFFDVRNTGEITPNDLRERMMHFFPDLSAREYKLLVSSDGPFTVDRLREMLHGNELTNFDPISEAFKVFDPHRTGYVDLNTLKTILTSLGLGDLSAEDMDVLIHTADGDHDGRISIEDFASMLDYNWQPPKMFPSAVELEAARKEQAKTEKAARALGAGRLQRREDSFTDK